MFSHQIYSSTVFSVGPYASASSPVCLSHNTHSLQTFICLFFLRFSFEASFCFSVKVSHVVSLLLFPVISSSPASTRSCTSSCFFFLNITYAFTPPQHPPTTPREQACLHFLLHGSAVCSCETVMFLSNICFCRL